MIIATKCKCGHSNHSEISPDWIKTGSCPIECSECGSIYIINVIVDEENKDVEEFPEDDILEERFPEDDILDMPSNILKENLTTFDLNTEVTIDNKEHELHGKNGIIIDKDFLHYKIQFSDGKNIWIPHHWALKKKTEQQ